MRRRASGALMMVLLVAWQSAYACHDPHGRSAFGADMEAAALEALISARLCSTTRTSTTPLRGDGGDRAASPTDGPADSPARDPAAMPGSACLHCTSGGCHAGGIPPPGGRVVATLPELMLRRIMTASRGNSGASARRSGHPVRGPPASGI